MCLYHLRFLDVISQKYTLSFQYTGSFYDGGQFENAVVKVTYGYYNGNTLGNTPEKVILNVDIC